MTHANGVVTSYQYDAASQLLSLVHKLGAATVNSFSYNYDKVGNRTAKTDRNGAANYTYDTLNRLVQATNPLPTNPLESFTYDEVGNRVNSNQNGASIFNQANQLTEDGNFTYLYDANGNQTRKTNKATLAFTSYEYDAENKLVRVVSNGTTINYKYDGLGRRVEKEINDGVTTKVNRFIYDNEDILLELDGNNQIVARYTHGFEVDEPLIVEKGGQSFFYHADGLGSVAEITNQSGAVVQRYTYSSFGKIESQLDLNFVQPYAFTGREIDPETGLYFYRERSFDPNTGRFLQEDPLGILTEELESGLNHLYVYVANNPINAIDPTGLRIILLPGKCGSSLPDPEVMDKLKCIDKCNGSLPVLVTSGKRTKAQNKCVKGAPKSRHVAGKAADIAIPGKSSAEVASMASFCGFTGISTYDPEKGGHTHVDIRPRPWNGHNGKSLPKGQVPEWRKKQQCSC